MITFKAIVISNNRRKDGTYPVKIRVTYKGVSRRLATTLVAKPSDLTRTLKIKSADILNKSDALIASMRDAVKDVTLWELEDKDVDWVVSHIKDSLSKDSFRLDFFEWSDKYILSKSPSTRVAYACALNAFARFLGKREIDINAISRTMLLEFMEMIDAEPRMHWDSKSKTVIPTRSEKIAKGASTRHLAKLQHLFMAAKDRYNDEDADRILIPRSPFDKITKVYPASHGQPNIGQELMQSIISAQVDSEVMRTALDVFIVSFGLMGANMADLYCAKPFKKDWVYNRQKTASRRADKAEMRVSIPECLRPYIERLEGKGSWWLNNLHKFASSRRYATQRVNKCLAQFCEDNGIDKFTMYAARHTWASLARKIGVDKSTIDDCLCHKGSFAIADIYAEKAWDLIQDTNRKVLELFEW